MNKDDEEMNKLMEETGLSPEEIHLEAMRELAQIGAAIHGMLNGGLIDEDNDKISYLLIVFPTEYDGASQLVANTQAQPNVIKVLEAALKELKEAPLSAALPAGHA